MDCDEEESNLQIKNYVFVLIFRTIKFLKWKMNGRIGNHRNSKS